MEIKKGRERGKKMKCTVGKYEKEKQKILVLLPEASLSREGQSFAHLSAGEARNWIDQLEKAVERLSWHRLCYIDRRGGLREKGERR